MAFPVGYDGTAIAILPPYGDHLEGHMSKKTQAQLEREIRQIGQADAARPRSLYGGGKLCVCGAKFDSGGEAHKVVAVPPQQGAADRAQVQAFEVVSLRLARATVEHLALSEEGRHEDYETNLAMWNATPPENRNKEDRPEPCLAYTYATAALVSHAASSRYVTIRVDRADAAEDLYYAVCSGTFQIQFPDAARRIADALRDRVHVTNPDLVARWPAPTGS